MARDLPKVKNGVLRLWMEKTKNDNYAVMFPRRVTDDPYGSVLCGIALRGLFDIKVYSRDCFVDAPVLVLVLSKNRPTDDEEYYEAEMYPGGATVYTCDAKTGVLYSMYGGMIQLVGRFAGWGCRFYFWLEDPN